MKLSRLLFYKSDNPESFLPRKKENAPMFDNPELNQILDSNKERVKKEGHSKLVLLPKYHPIRRSALPESSIYVADRLKSHGFKSYLCGGTVRDLVQGVHVNDYDFVTDASNDDLRGIFDNIFFQKIPSGHEFGYIDFDGDIVDVCTMVNIPPELKGVEFVPDFNPENLYSKNLLFDAYQRDITINSMYFDIDTEEIIDYFGGLYDLREGIVDMAASTEVKFKDDPRKILRALRFVARFGFVLSDNLDKAMRMYANEVVDELSPSSIARNLPDFFSGGFAYSGTEVLLEYGILGKMFPAISHLAEKEEYINYVKRISYIADWIYDEGAVGLPLLTMAAFLWPGVSELKKGGSMNPEEEVLGMQERIMSLKDDEREFFLEALHIDEAINPDDLMKELESIYEKPTFEDALKVLQLYYLKQSF